MAGRDPDNDEDDDEWKNNKQNCKKNTLKQNKIHTHRECVYNTNVFCVYLVDIYINVRFEICFECKWMRDR